MCGIVGAIAERQIEAILVFLYVADWARLLRSI